MIGVFRNIKDREFTIQNENMYPLQNLEIAGSFTWSKQNIPDRILRQIGKNEGNLIKK